MRVIRVSCALLALGGAACGLAVPIGEAAAQEADAVEVDAGSESFEDVVARIEKRRQELCSRYRRGGPEVRAAVRDEARRYVVDAMVEQIFPRWLGMPWTMAVIRDGLKPDARVPWEKGRGVSCSFFVTSTLENAGLRLAGRRVFAGAVSLPVQRSLSPRKRDLRRWHGIGPAGLKRKMLAWGDGLYIVGLNCHIGYIVVRDRDVRFVHSSYTEPFEVVDEPLVDAAAIAYSPGYVVTALFRDDRLIDYWLTGRRVPFQKSRSHRY
jgi:hypothetical protein